MSATGVGTTKSGACCFSHEPDECSPVQEDTSQNQVLSSIKGAQPAPSQDLLVPSEPENPALADLACAFNTAQRVPKMFHALLPWREAAKAKSNSSEDNSLRSVPNNKNCNEVMVDPPNRLLEQNREKNEGQPPVEEGDGEWLVGYEGIIKISFVG